ncbi:hypothetical protein Tco_1147650 [Tanacetum coccineum]
MVVGVGTEVVPEQECGEHPRVVSSREWRSRAEGSVAGGRAEGVVVVGGGEAALVVGDNDEVNGFIQEDDRRIWWVGGSSWRRVESHMVKMIDTVVVTEGYGGGIGR